MKDQVFDYEQYAQMPVSIRRTMLKQLGHLPISEANDAYMLIYERDPDPELHEMARKELEQNGIHVDGDHHAPIPEPSPGNGSGTITLDGGDGQVKTPADLAKIANLFIFDPSQTDFVTGKSPHLNRFGLYVLGFFLVVLIVVAIIIVVPVLSTADLGMILIVLLLVAAVVGVILVVFINTYRRLQLFETQGKLFQGQIVEARGRWTRTTTKDSDNKPTVTRSYEVTIRWIVRLPDGQKLTSSNNQTRNDLANTFLPEPGTPIAVLYVDNQTYMLM